MAMDRISYLHDSILHQIFSFLPTKDVVQTSILSKEWQHLWKSLPYLHFNESDFINKNSFTNFVDKILLQHDSQKLNTNIKLIRVKLLCEYARKSSYIQSWITAAVKASVQELELYSPCKAIGGALPSCLFQCNSLVTLKLNLGYVVRFPDDFCFPNMKIMDLRDVIFGKTFSHQLLKSRNLEELFLTHCKININNSSPSSCKVQDRVADDHHPPESLSHLNKAIIGLGNLFGEEDGDLCASKFITALSNVQVLWLSNSCVQLLQYCGRNPMDYLPTFCNLKHLELTLGTKDGDVGVMKCLLCCSPVLQSLRIRFFNHNFRYLVSRCEKELKPEELSPHLKWIRMDNFRATKNQVELVRFFLANAPVLEEMTLHLDRYLDLTSQELFEFPRASTSCELVLISETFQDNFAYKLFSSA